VIACLGCGWESEVYRIRERKTRIERAAKIFFPRRNPANRTAVAYAKKFPTAGALRICLEAQDWS